MTLEIVVDELVLRGVPNERAADVAAALEGRLAALGKESVRDGIQLAPRDEVFRRTPEVQAPSSPGALGEAVAGAVWGAVSGGRR
jgi:hypothetical protein